MSVTAPNVSLNSALATGGLNSAPAINPATEPAAIRNGGAAAKQAYQVGLSFEQMLVTQLTQELASTATNSGDDSSSDGSGDSGGSGGASGLMGSDPASSAYASMLPQTMTSSIMAGGGTGIALQIAKSIDPALAYPSANQSDPTSGAKS